MESPPVLKIVLLAFSGLSNIESFPGLLQKCKEADLVVSLGGGDLSPLANSLPQEKAALALLGPKDDIDIPEPFRPLHAGGFNFRGWRIAGFSGAPIKPSLSAGNYLPENEAEALMSSLPACDIFLSHVPPSTLLRSSGLPPEAGFSAFDQYVQQKSPIYHFYAHPSPDELLHGPEEIGKEIGSKTLITGVHDFIDIDLLFY